MELRLAASIAQPLRNLVDSARYREALALFLEWKEAAEPSAPEVQMLAAHAAARIGEYDLSTALAGSAQTTFGTSSNQAGLLDCANLLGAVAFERGRIEQAETEFRRVLDLAEGSNRPRYTGRGANNLGNIAHLRGNSEEAAALYQKALAAFQEAQDHRGIAETWHNLALMERDTTSGKAALDTCARAVDAAERLGSNGLIALTLLGRAELLIERGEFDDAMSDIDRAQLLAWLEGDEPDLLDAERLRSLCALRNGQARRAHDHAELVRRRASDAGCVLLAAEAGSISALALKLDGRISEAEAVHEAVVRILEEIGATAVLTRHLREWHRSAA